MGDILFHFSREEQRQLLAAERAKDWLDELARLNARLRPKPDEEKSPDGYGVADGGKL